MKRTDILHKYLNPRIVFIIMLVPFMCICPLVIGSITVGFPYPYLQNNLTLKSYNTVFNEIYSTTDSIKPVGQYFSKIATIKQRRGTCTLFAGKAFITSLSQTEISAKLLKKFSDVAANYQSDAELYAFIRNAEIKIIPININQPFTNVDVTLDLRNNFKLSEKDMPLILPLPVEGETPADEATVKTKEIKQDVIYLAYLINTKAFDSLDFRCN